MSVLLKFHLMYVQIVLVRSRLLSSHLLRKSPMFFMYNVYFFNYFSLVLRAGFGLPPFLFIAYLLLGSVQIMVVTI